MTRIVSDLAPFLFPTRWMRAREAGHLADAARYSGILMRANSASIAEGLCYTLIHDEQSLAQMQKQHEFLSQIKDQIQGRERFGLLPPGASDDIRSLMNQLDQASLLLKETVREQYRALAQASGFMNPSAISAIRLDLEATIEKPQPVVTEEFRRLALERSYELRQMNSLIDYAKGSQEQRYYNWIDPNSDPSSNLGFGFGSSLEIGRAQIREAILKHSQLQSILLQKVENTASQIESSIQRRTLALDGLALQRQRVKRLMDSLGLGKAISTTDLSLAVQQLMKSELELIDADFSYRIAHSNLMRLLFTDHYAQAAELP
ncbi:TolC family protein [bacterium]|nr:TolC family protein [bacterium]